VTPSDYIRHAKEVLGYDDARIERNRHAIETGRLYGIRSAVEQNSAAQSLIKDKEARTDSDREDKKARHHKAYTTQACIDWRKSQGHMILNREHMNRQGRRVDIYGGWDVLSLKDGVHYLDQAFPPGGWPDHEKKMIANRSIERGSQLNAVMHGLAFERGVKEPVEIHAIDSAPSK